MLLEKIDLKKNKVLKISTIIIYVIAILIFEIGICNGMNLKNFIYQGVIKYNFSLCRIVSYIIFLIAMIKNIDKFIPEALETIKLPIKKYISIIYVGAMFFIDLYVFIKWTSIYKELTLLIMQLMGLLFIIYISSNYIKNVIVIVSTIGMVFTFATDFHHTLDEKKHMMSVINISSGNLQYAKNPLCEPTYNNIIFNCDIDSFVQFFERKYEPDLTNDWNRTEETEVYYICSSPADYNFVLYLPATIGVVFAKVFAGSIADIYIMGRLFNLIAYAVMVIVMLKLLPYKKKIFYIITMLPFQLLLAASFSVDGICCGILGIFIAYCLRLSEMDYEKIKLKQILTLMILYAMCLLAKNLAYCAIIIFVLVLPIKKVIKNNKKSLPIISTILIIAMLVCATLMVNKLFTSAADGGDIRGGETSLVGQAKFLLESPLNIVKVGFEHIMNALLNYNWYTDLNHATFFGKYSTQIFFMELIFIIYISCTDEYVEIKKRTQIVSIITFLGVFASTSLMLYLTFTPVGQINISGYQPRYMISLFPIILMLINNKKNIIDKEQLKEKTSEVNVCLTQGMFIIIDLIFLISIV